MASPRSVRNGKMRDSSDPWRYVMVLNKFLVNFLEAGLIKCFGVLIADMVTQFDSNYKTMAFICSLPATMQSLLCPLVYFMMRLVNMRILTVVGSILCSVPLVCASFVENLFLIGVLMFMTALNDYFPESFIFYTTLSTFGETIGAFCLPVIAERSLEAYGLSGAFLILGGICLNVLPCALTLRPPREYSSVDSHCSDTEKSDVIITSADGPSSSSTDSDSDSHFIDQSKSTNTSNNTSYQENASASRGNMMAKLKSCVYYEEPLYALVSPSFFLMYYFSYSWLLFLIPRAESLGIESSRAVFLASIAGVGGILGKIALLIIMHAQLDLSIMLVTCCTICDITIFINSLSTAYPYQAVMAFIQGVTVFMANAMGGILSKSTITNEKNMPIALTLMGFASGLGILVGDMTSASFFATSQGHIYDVTQSYQVVYNMLGLLLLVVIINLTVFLIFRFRAKKQRGDR
ncbi:monocarboxylate transporter 5-like [Diadema antillarum]|uniref:monocarboxylate transporter 5-like n=1 Tax=Diadema antillarum TaxID=105358 RepID=UPI003A84666E